MFQTTLLALAAAGALATGPAAAQHAEHDAAAACAQIDAQLPLDLAAWPQRQALVSAARPDDLATAVVTPGQAVNATLHPTREVTYLAQPEKPGGSVAYGGLLRVHVTEPGTYRVVLDNKAWIDMLRNGRAVTSTAHAPGPACTTARKTVEFPLERGDYVLQVAANPSPRVAVLVTPRP